MGIDPLSIFSGGSRKVDKPRYDGDVFTLEFGTERVTKAWRKGVTIAQAFSEYAAELGFDTSRAGVAYKNRNEIQSASTEVSPNQTYTAYTTHESKGRCI